MRRSDDDAELAFFRGRLLHLRELRATDRSGIEALLTQVAPSDLQMRFFALFRRVPPVLLDHLMHIDPAQRLTVAAVLESGRGNGAAEILGVARAHRTVGQSAEAALLVRSDLKGEGLGTMLLGILIARCRKWGVSQIVAEVIQSNGRMLRLAKKYGFRCEHLQDDTCQLLLDLNAQQ